jgi:hypothetical protein
LLAPLWEGGGIASPPRELAKPLNRATQPGPVSPGGGEQAQRHQPASHQSPGKVFAMQDATPPWGRGTIVGGDRIDSAW